MESGIHAVCAAGQVGGDPGADQLCALGQKRCLEDHGAVALVHDYLVVAGLVGQRRGQEEDAGQDLAGGERRIELIQGNADRREGREEMLGLPPAQILSAVEGPGGCRKAKVSGGRVGSISAVSTA